MDSKAGSIDEYLDAVRQTDVAFKAVLDVVVDSPKLTRVIPYVDQAGCLCESAMVVPRSMIRSVQPTDQSALCCGARRQIVLIRLSDDASVPAVNAFGAIGAAAKVSPAGAAFDHLLGTHSVSWLRSPGRTIASTPRELRGGAASADAATQDYGQFNVHVHVSVILFMLRVWINIGDEHYFSGFGGLAGFPFGDASYDGILVSVDATRMFSETANFAIQTDPLTTMIFLQNSSLENLGSIAAQGLGVAAGMGGGEGRWDR